MPIGSEIARKKEKNHSIPNPVTDSTFNGNRVMSHKANSTTSDPVNNITGPGIKGTSTKPSDNATVVGKTLDPSLHIPRPSVKTPETGGITRNTTDTSIPSDKTGFIQGFEELDMLERNRLLGGNTIWSHNQTTARHHGSNADRRELEQQRPKSVTDNIQSNDQQLKPIGMGKYDQYRNAVAMVTSEMVNEGGKKFPVIPKSDFQEKMSVSRSTNTDPLPQVESFKERYEVAMKEKKSLEGKLELSEDKMMRMQKQHGHELENAERKARSDSRKVRVYMYMTCS